MPVTNAWRCSILCLAFLCEYAQAGEGVIEINQARALAGQVTDGDSAGFPVTLTRAGSYVLTSELDLRAQANAVNLTAIAVEADGVSIDLNGFRLIGPVRCVGNPPDTPVTCAPGGHSGVGVFVGYNNLSQPYETTRVSHGTIEGFAFAGISCGGACVIERVEARHNEGVGISVGEGSTVRDCTAALNASNGVDSARALVVSSMLVRNGGVGARLGVGSLVYDSIASRNAGVALAGFSFVGESSPTAYRDCSFTNNNGGNANNQVSGAIPLGTSICGTDAICP